MQLVTGGAGFIGSHLVEALLAAGRRVRVLDNFSSGRRDHLPLASAGLEVVEGDVRDWETVRRAMEGVTHVFHLAARVSVPQSVADPLATHAVNVNGTLNVLEAARQAGVQRLVFSSSCSVYGDNPDLPLKETSAPRPLSPYAASKLAGEVYCQVFWAAYRLPTVCLRYFNVYGRRQNPAGDYAAVIPKFNQCFRAGRPPLIYGDGRQTRDFVHVADVVRANLLASQCQEAVGGVFNVASGRPVSLLELAAHFNALYGACFEPSFAPERPGDIRHSLGDGRRARAVLGFEVALGLVEGLEAMVNG